MPDTLPLKTSVEPNREQKYLLHHRAGSYKTPMLGLLDSEVIDNCTNLCNCINVTRIEKFILTQLMKGKFVLTLHARERMNERFISELDIVEIARTLKSIKRQKANDTYLLTGLSTWKEKLKVSIAVRVEIIVVTVFYEESL